MPVTYSVDRGVLAMVADESATAEDWTGAIDEALRSPGFRPGMALVADARRMARIPSTREVFIRVEFVTRLSKQGLISRWALVMTEGVQFGMGRMAEAYAERSPSPFRVFTNVDEAMAWVQAGRAGG